MKNSQSGFIRNVIIILIALILLSHFGYGIDRLAQLPIVTKIINALVAIFNILWSIVGGVVIWIWNILLKIWHIIAGLI